MVVRKLLAISMSILTRGVMMFCLWKLCDCFFTYPLSSRLSLIRVCRQEPSLAILFSIFEGTLYEFEFFSCEQRNDIQKFFDICMIYGNAYANASAMVFYGRSNACLVAVDSKYSELWISLLQWK